MNFVSAQGSQKTRMMGLSDGRKSVRIGLAVLIQYRSVTDTQPPSHPVSHVAVAITLNAQASSLKRTEEILSEAQAGFRSNRSTIDQILAEKYQEFGKELSHFSCYIDFRNAFDSMWRKGLWRVMRHYGYPEKIVRILENMYNETFIAIRVDGYLTDWFNTIVGLLQGCVLSPLLLNIFIEVIIAIALNDIDIGAVLSGVLLSDLRFTDDIALLSEDACGLQSSVNQVVLLMHIPMLAWVCALTKLKLKSNTSARERNNSRYWLMGNNYNKAIPIYLGGNVSTEDGADGNITRRLGLARGVLQSLCDIWTAKDLSKATKLCVYETLVLSVLL